MTCRIGRLARLLTVLAGVDEPVRADCDQPATHSVLFVVPDGGGQPDRSRADLCYAVCADHEAYARVTPHWTQSYPIRIT